MSSGTRNPQVETRGSRPPPLAWTVWPVREEPWLAAAFGALGVMAGLVVGWTTAKAYLALVASGIVFGSLIPFWLPGRYELSADGASRRILGLVRHMPWDAVARVEPYPKGLLLVPSRNACPVDTFWALYVPWGAHREEVLAQVRHYLDEEQTHVMGAP